MAAVSPITSQSCARGWPHSTVREIDGLFQPQPLTVCLAANHNQPGDAKKGSNVIIDVVKGEGAAKDKAFTPVILLGSDCYEFARSTLTNSIAKFDEWKEVTVSTDRDDA